MSKRYRFVVVNDIVFNRFDPFSPQFEKVSPQFDPFLPQFA